VKKILDEAVAKAKERLAEVAHRVREAEIEVRTDSMNLSTKYLGMVLRTPLVPSASPLSNGLDNVR